MSRTDESLLKSFQIHGDEEAFGILYNRYSGLVYHCAFRRTQNHTLSEDITQKVFCSLAQKTTLFTSRSAHLPALLHRATVYEASKAIRTEVRHQRRKDAYMKAKDTESVSSATSPWGDVIPHLDQALDRLSQSDRSILLLHYLNGLSFPEISNHVGKSAAAVQKQSRRALEKLSKHLKHKGVTLSVVTLGKGLSSEFSKTSPIQFSPEIIFNSSALPAHSFAHTTKWLLTAKMKYWAPAAMFIFCSVPLLYQWMDIRKLHNENSLLQDQLLNLSRKSSNENRYPFRKHLNLEPKGLPSKPTLSDLGYLAEAIFTYEIQNQNPHAGLLARRQIKEGSSEQILELLNLSPKLLIGKEKREYIVNVLFQKLLSSDFTMALDKGLLAVVENHLSDSFSTSLSIDKKVASTYRDWLDRDSIAAQEWLKNQEKLGNLAHKGLEFKTPYYDTLRRELTGYFLENHNLVGAVSFLQMMTENERRNILKKYFKTFKSEKSKTTKNQKLMTIQLVRQSFLPEENTLQMFEELGSILTMSDSSHFINEVELTQRERVEILLGISRAHLVVMSQKSFGEDVEISLSHLLPLQNWLATVKPDQHHSLLGRSLGRFTQNFYHNRSYRESLEAFFQVYQNGEIFLSFLEGLEEDVDLGEVNDLQELVQFIEESDFRDQAVERILDSNK